MSATIIGQVAVEVRPDTTGFRRDAKAKLQAEEKALPKINVSFEADISSALSEVRDALKDMQREADRNKVEVKVQLDAASRRVVQTRLDMLGRNRRVLFSPEMNDGAVAKVATTLAALSGARSVGNIGTDLREVVENLDKSVPKIGAWALALTNVSAYAMTATSNMLAFGSSLATIAPAALALPGIFGGMALGAGATFAVFKDFNTVLPGVKKELSALQDQMSSTFWDKAKAPIQGFIDTIFPQFASGMKVTSSALGDFFGNLATSASGSFNGELQSMFADLGKSIRIAGRYSDDFLGIITQLGKVGAGNLPRLAGWFGDIAAQFNDWLSGKGQKGLQDLVDTGISALQDLGGILVETGRTLAGLANAAEKAGGSSLSMMRDTMKSVADTVNSNSFQRSLTGVFAAAHDAMHELSTRTGPELRSFLGRLADTLTTVLPSAGRAAGTALGAIFKGLDQPEVQKAVIGLFDSLETSINSIAPAMPAVGKALAGIADVIGSLAENISRGLGDALKIVAPAVSGLADDLQPLIRQLGTLFDTLVKAAGPSVTDLVSGLGDLAGVLAAVLGPINQFLSYLNKIPVAGGSALSTLTEIGVLVGGAMWLGSGVQSKLIGFSDNLLDLATKSGRAEGAVLNLAAGVENTAGGISKSRLAMLGAGAAVGVLGNKMAGTNETGKILADTASGALIGSAFGPGWGTAIGAAGGALYGLYDSLADGQSSFNTAVDTVQDYIDTLDQLTGKLTEQTKQTAYSNLGKTGALAVAKKYGIPDRDVIAAATGSVDAFIRIKKRLNDAIAAGTLDKSYKQDFMHSLTLNAKEIDQGTASIQRRAAATAPLKEILTGFPKKIVTDLETNGVPGSAREVAKLQGKYNLTPKRIRTLIQLLGTDVTLKQVEKVYQHLVQTGKVKVRPKVDVDTKSADADTHKVKVNVGQIGKLKGVAQVGVKDNATKPLNVVTEHITRIAKTNVKAVVGVQDNASSILSHVSSELTALNGKTATTYIRTVHTGGGAGGGGGGSNGTSQRTGFVSKQAIDASAVAAVDAWQKQLRKELAKATSKVDANWDALWKKFSKPGQHKALQRMFGDDRKAMNDLAGTIDRLQTRLDAAQQNLQNLLDQQAQYRASMIDSINATADPTQLGAQTYDGIVRGMQKAAAQAVAFQGVIQELIKSGLNSTTLQQILTAGPQAGLATAQAILQGGVSQINAIQSTIQDAASGVAQAAGNTMFGGLIADAETQVNSLIKQLKPLQQQLRKFAKDLIDALRDQLRKEAGSLGFGNGAKGGKGGKGTGGSSGKGNLAGGGIGPRSATKAAAAAYAAASSGTTVVSSKTLIYNAAANNSLDSEDDLFSALGKAGGWL